MLSRRVPLSLPLIAAVCLLGACGSKDDSPSASAEATATPSAAQQAAGVREAITKVSAGANACKLLTVERGQIVLPGATQGASSAGSFCTLTGKGGAMLSLNLVTPAMLQSAQKNSSGPVGSVGAAYNAIVKGFEKSGKLKPTKVTGLGLKASAGSSAAGTLVTWIQSGTLLTLQYLDPSNSGETSPDDVISVAKKVSSGL